MTDETNKKTEDGNVKDAGPPGEKDKNAEKEKKDKKAEKVTEQAPPQSSPRKSAPASNREPASSSSSSSSGASGVLAILLSLVALGVASYPAYMLYMESQKKGPDPLEAVDALDAKIGNLTASQSVLDQRLAEMASTLAADNSRDYMGQQVDALTKKLMGEMQGLRDEFGTSSQDWLYAEVEYLIRMANQRALMERDVTSALELLTAADAIIREAEGLTAHSLREALAQDIAKLKAVNEPDVQGIFLELSALTAQVPVLKRPLPAFDMDKNAQVETPAPSGWLDRMQQMLTDAGTRLAELVDFRRGDVEIKPILPPAEEYYLRQNLILKLQMAQLALLEGNTAVFQVSVGEAATWVRDYFDQDDAATTAMMQTLDALVLADIATDVPDISASLRAVRTQLQDFKGETTR